MTSTAKRPRRPIARELMEEVIVTVPQQMSLRGAGRLLMRAEVGAAPVVDANGRCVGVLAASALVPLAMSIRSTGAAAFHGCAWSDWQILEEGAGPSDEVREYMSLAPPLVGPEAPLTAVVRALVDAGVDRVIVVNAEGAPLGTVSATRVLAAVTRGGRARDYGSDGRNHDFGSDDSAPDELPTLRRCSHSRPASAAR